MGMISKIIQKIEGYEWEEKHDFEVQGITRLEEGFLAGSFAIHIKQLNEKDHNPVQTLVDRLRSYSSDEEIFAIVSLKQSEVPYQWQVELVIDKNEGYVSTEGAKE